MGLVQDKAVRQVVEMAFLAGARGGHYVTGDALDGDARNRYSHVLHDLTQDAERILADAEGKGNA